ncbi:arginine kinase-like isoform X1 [Tigriopus californicus]|uniref:arginine kinase-like isoform X1 n=1 Tax=Tigriopus californicus TaxID=6832 RepID=UPI0027DAA3E6|nr:arginine kinase-like isoform X1 [Tigriopus californicus]
MTITVWKVLPSVQLIFQLGFLLESHAQGPIGCARSSEPKPESSNAEYGVNPSDITYVDQGFKALQEAEDCQSLLKKHLTKEILDELKILKTRTFGSTLKDVIQSGIENIDSGVGVYAPDPEAYGVFANLFDPIIEDYHGGFSKSQKHPPSHFGNPEDFGDLDPDREFIVSTRIRCGRSIEGFPFNPNMKKEDYENMEKLVSETLEKFDGELKGTYHSLESMSPETQRELVDQHYLFKQGDRFLEAANAIRHWPSGRGIFFNDERSFLVWCGEEDHLRIISMQNGGHVGEVYGRLVRALEEMEKEFKYSHDERLGFLTFCPTNLGTTIRASVHIKLPRLAAEGGIEMLQKHGDEHQLQVRGSSGEHSEAVGGLYDISNRERMGLTEYQAVKKMYEGVNELIKMEKALIAKDEGDLAEALE